MEILYLHSYLRNRLNTYYKYPVIPCFERSKLVYLTCLEGRLHTFIDYEANEGKYVLL